MFKYMKYAVFAGLAATVPLANWFIGNVGLFCSATSPCVIPVGFGLMAPSGVLLIGVALVLRDYLQELWNKKAVVASIVVGSGLSFILANPFIATASLLAYAAGESSDFIVYNLTRRFGKSIAVLSSGLVGSIVDSVVFLLSAFGSLEFAIGNIVGKLYSSVGVSAFLWFKEKFK
jgi:uncharacterized PurR-regulated membrane protein YhhQ (DUF165 family)